MIKICSGCGSVIQYKDSNKVGYSPKKDAKLCERCFKLKNYNKQEVIDLKYSNDEIIDLLNSNDGAIFFVTDFLSISNKVVETFKKINHHNKYLVINKVDYIPKSINKENYAAYIKENYKIKNDVILVSALKKYNINSLLNKIKEYKNSYICGYTNSGKSLIISELCTIIGKKCNILSSLMPNTTLDLIKVRVDENTHMFDTPGFINDFEFIKDNHPKKFIKPITIQTKENDTISLGENIKIKCDSVNSLTFYISDLVNVKKNYKDNTVFKNVIKVNEKSDLLIYGYGFINIKNKCKLEINIDSYEIRNSYF